MTISSIRSLHQVAIDKSRLHALRQGVLNPTAARGRVLSCMQKIHPNIYRNNLCFFLNLQELMRMATCCRRLYTIVRTIPPKSPYWCTLLDRYIPGLSLQLQEKFGLELNWYAALHGYGALKTIIYKDTINYILSTSRYMQVMRRFSNGTSTQFSQTSYSFDHPRALQLISKTPLPSTQFSDIEFITSCPLDPTRNIFLYVFKHYFALQCGIRRLCFPCFHERFYVDQGCLIRKNSLDQLEWISMHVEGECLAQTNFLIQVSRYSIKNFDATTMLNTHASNVICRFSLPNERRGEGYGFMSQMQLQPNGDDLFFIMPPYELRRINIITKQSFSFDLQIPRVLFDIRDKISIQFITHNWLVIARQKELLLCQIANSNRKDGIIARYQLQTPWQCNDGDGRNRQITMERIGTRYLAIKTLGQMAIWGLPNLNMIESSPVKKNLCVIASMIQFDSRAGDGPMVLTPGGIFMAFNHFEKNTLLLRLKVLYCTMMHTIGANLKQRSKSPS